MQRVLLTISYDGSQFYGWQKQKTKRSVQVEVENALSRLLGKETSVVGSSRTDAGVHALGQCAHFDCADTFPVEKFPVALNSLLSADVRIVGARKVKSDFSARFDVKKKTYVYALGIKDPSPLYRNLCAFSRYELDLEKVRACLELLKGKHNFKGFCSSGAQVKTFERVLYEASVKQKGDFLIFTFTGNGFLQHMVRILVGTAVDVGRGGLSLESVKEALVSGDRSKVGKTMPPQGLYLKKIYFGRR